MNKRQHVERIAANCKTVTVNLPRQLVLVRYPGKKGAGREAMYDMSGDRPAYRGSDQPGDPSKTVQDGMRLAAVWHVHGRPGTLIHAAKRAALRPYQQELIDMMSKRNPIIDKIKFVVDSGLLTSGFDLAEPGADKTAIWFQTWGRALRPGSQYAGIDRDNLIVLATKRGYGNPVKWADLVIASREKPATVDELDFADVDEGNGRLLSPDSFVWTPEMYRVIGAGKTMSDLLDMWHTLAAAARWKK